jgi:hypothetical protein
MTDTVREGALFFCAVYREWNDFWPNGRSHCSIFGLADGAEGLVVFLLDLQDRRQADRTVAEHVNDFNCSDALSKSIRVAVSPCFWAEPRRPGLFMGEFSGPVLTSRQLVLNVCSNVAPRNSSESAPLSGAILF